MKKFSEFILDDDRRRTNVHHGDSAIDEIYTMWEAGKRNAAKIAVDDWIEENEELFPIEILEDYEDWIGMKQKRVSRVLNECDSKGIEVLQVLKNPEAYTNRLSSLDSYMIRDLEVHGWDVYIESIK